MPSPANDIIRIIAVDDHSLLRSALCDLLNTEDDLQVVADTDTSAGLAELVEEHDADVVLLDVEMPEHHAPTVVSQLVERFPDLHILILTMYNDSQLVSELLARGARGYLHKSVLRESLLSAIRNTGGRDPQITVSVPYNGVFDLSPSGDSQPTLSPREREVLSLAGIALSNRQIASRLGITEGTVKRHLRNIFEKLGATSRIDAVNKAVDSQIIKRRSAAS